jgi:hypothetical protein
MKISKNIIKERSHTHGKFEDNAHLTAEMVALLRCSRNWHRLNDAQELAIRMVCHKLARALSGNHLEVDHYKDIAGYAELIVNNIKNDRDNITLDELCRDLIKGGYDAEI